MTSDQLRVLVVGCGHMGASHALAYDKHPGFQIVGLVSRGSSKNKLNNLLTHPVPLYNDFQQALTQSQCQVVCISTYPDTHETYALAAIEAGCHVFLEKPMAITAQGAERIQSSAAKHQKKLVIGYILRHHPVWQRFVMEAQGLGKPLVMRMNLNQQSHGNEWAVHKKLMESLSPIVDCGVHYLDIMCQMTQAKPVAVSAIGVRLTPEIDQTQYNYGQLQIRFDDGSVGWYEAGWGPMMSETAFFVKDVIGPRGSVSLVQDIQKSDDVAGHTKSDVLLKHHADLDDQGHWKHQDHRTIWEQTPDHQGLCDLEQEYFYQAIIQDLDLSQHVLEAVDSLKIALACDQAVKTGQTVFL